MTQISSSITLHRKPKDGINPVTYEIVPSADKVAFARQPDGTLLPSVVAVYFSHKTTEGGTITMYDGRLTTNLVRPNDGTAKYNTLYRTMDANGTYTSYLWAKDLPNGTLNIPCTTTIVSVEVVLTSAGSAVDVAEGNIVARATIPVVKDGANGQGSKGSKGAMPLMYKWTDIRDTTLRVYSGLGDNESYYTIVIDDTDKNEAHYYSPLVTHNIGENERLTDTSLWVAANSVKLTATDLFFARRAYIDNLGVNNLLLTDGTASGVYGGMCIPDTNDTLGIGDVRFWIGGNNPAEAPSRIYKDGSAVFNNITTNGLQIQKTRHVTADTLRTLGYCVPIDLDTYKSLTIDTDGALIVLPQYDEVTYGDVHLPAVREEGIQISIRCTPTLNYRYANWMYCDVPQDYAERINYFRTLLNNGSMICSDIRQLVAVRNAPMHYQGGLYIDDNYNNAEYMHGRMTLNGAIGRMLFLAQGQTLKLISTIQEYETNEGTQRCVVWVIENSESFALVNRNTAYNYLNGGTYARNYTQFYAEYFGAEWGSGINPDNWIDGFFCHPRLDEDLINANAGDRLAFEFRLIGQNLGSGVLTRPSFNVLSY